jgi:ribosome-associated protein
MIRLGQLLKLAGVIESGAGVKGFLATESVLVNGELEKRRGRQLHAGDVVRIGADEFRVSTAPPDEQASARAAAPSRQSD